MSAIVERTAPSAPPEPANVPHVQAGRVDAGGPEESAVLAPAVYAELRRIARAYMRRERPDHTLQPTALVHEALLRLDGAVPRALAEQWRDAPVDTVGESADPAAFLALAARTMRRVLVDHARRRSAAKRQVLAEPSTDHALAPAADGGAALDLLALDDALARLAGVSPRAARVVELRFFAGLDVDAVARALGVGTATVKRDWALARAWLRRALDATGASAEP